MTKHNAFKKLEIELTELIEENMFDEDWSDSDDRSLLSMDFDETIYEEMAVAAINVMRTKERYHNYLGNQDMLK